MHQYDINKTMAMMTRGLEITQIVRAYVNAKLSWRERCCYVAFV